MKMGWVGRKRDTLSLFSTGPANRENLGERMIEAAGACAKLSVPTEPSAQSQENFLTSARRLGSTTRLQPHHNLLIQMA